LAKIVKLKTVEAHMRIAQIAVDRIEDQVHLYFLESDLHFNLIL